MNNLIPLSTMRYRAVLDSWLLDCRRRFELRFPDINFYSDKWPIRSIYNSKQPNWSFEIAISEFSNKDRSFIETLRCILAEIVLLGEPKILMVPANAFRKLVAVNSSTIFQLTPADIRNIEIIALKRARESPPSAATCARDITTLSNHLENISTRGIIPRLGYHVSLDVNSELQAINRHYKNKIKSSGHEILDLKITALNEAFNAVINDDKRLSSADKVSVCAMVRKLCAPSRINEIVCSKIDDFVNIESYADKPREGANTLHTAHQLLVTMKGSKGAQWSAKPVLTFMIDAFHFTESAIKQHGAKSRALIEWYQKNPAKLFLPEGMERLRGKPMSREDLARIVYLTENPRSHNVSIEFIFKTLKKFSFKSKNPRSYNSAGRVNARAEIDFIPWCHIELYLLQRVKTAMDKCRRVTQLNHYEGDLSKMLFLFDDGSLPFLPNSLSDSTIRACLKSSKDSRRHASVFEKLKINIPVNGRVQAAEMDTHDPRRWLTTMALLHGEELSNVIVNKWANRSSLAQMKAYDFRSPEEIAATAAMPEPKELMDLSHGLMQVKSLEKVYGLSTQVVVAQEAGISVTSMDQILHAVDERPIARNSEQIIILYPTQFGACLHQHHETPCRRYSTCLTCNMSISIKGHAQTNHEIRNEALSATAAVINQLDKLIPALNRGLADCPDLFAEHILTLVERGMCAAEMTEHLIREFQSIKNQIKDRVFRKRIEEAHVSQGMVDLLDDDLISKGALMKYRNPTQHGNPGLEVVIEENGGRKEIDDNEKNLNKYLRVSDKRKIIRHET